MERNRRSKQILGVGLVVALISVAIQVILPIGDPPELVIGEVPKGYHLNGLVKDGSDVDLAEQGPARIGGTLEGDAAVVDVIVSGGGQSEHATFDRTVSPPVWWVFAAPPKSGPAEFTITAVGTDGSTSKESITVDFELPDEAATIIHPEVVVLGTKGSPSLTRWDPGNGTADVSGAKLGQVHLGTILSSGPLPEIAEYGLLRRVVGYVRDGEVIRTQTEPIALDEAILQAKFDSGGTGSTGGHGRSYAIAKPRTANGARSEIAAPDMTLGFGVGMSPGTTAQAALDDFGKCKAEDCIDAIRVERRVAGGESAKGPGGKGEGAPSDAAMTLELAASASGGVGVDLDIDWNWDWFKSGPRGHFNIGVELNGAVAARMSVGQTLSRADIDLGAALAASRANQLLKFKGDKTFWNKDLAPITIAVGPVPVVFVPGVKVSATWKGGLTINTTVSAAGSFKLRGGVNQKYSGLDLDVGVEADASGDKDLRYNVGLTGTANLEFEIEARVLTYDSFGATIGSRVKLGTVGTLGEDSKRGPYIRAAMTVTLACTIGVAGEVPIVNKQLFNYDREIISKKIAKFSAEKYFNEVDTSLEPGIPPPPPAPPPIDPVTGTDLAMMLVVDTSGSMSDTDGNGVVKMDGAKSAMRMWVDQLVPSIRVGLRSYPSPGGSCDAGVRVHEVSPVDVPGLQKQIDTLSPSGDTPTALALSAAFEDLPKSGKRTVVLVSDGESNCGGDPCEVAKSLVGQGVGLDVTINSIGFRISDAGAKELKCIAKATGGKFSTVEDSDQLTDNLVELAGPVLTVQLEAPKTVEFDESGSLSEPPVIRARVKNAGGKPAQDVIVSLSTTDNNTGIIDKGRPIGTLQPGDSVPVEWALSVKNTGQDRNVDFTVKAEMLEGRPDDAVKDSATIGVVVGDTDRLDEVGAVLRAANRVAILGDSFSSGEGARAYLPGTDTASKKGKDGQSNGCHRSESTYGKGSFKERVILACSGAVTADLTSASNFHTKTDSPKPLPSQVDQLTGVKGNVDAVLLTMGGNDVHFVEIATACVVGSECALPLTVCYEFGGQEQSCISSASKMLEEGLDGLVDNLVAGYEAIDGELNGRVRRQQRKGRQAPIVVLAYPKLLPVSADRQNNCVRGMSPTEVRMANRVVERLNSSIRDAVDRARVMNLPVYFAASTERAFQADLLGEPSSHTLCDPDQYVNDIQIADMPKPVSGDIIAKESLHPNVHGYEAMTRRLLVDARSWEVLPDARRSVDVAPTLWSPVGELGGSVTAGDRAKVAGSGFAPGALVTAQVASRAIAVGSQYADQSGEVSLEIALPTWVAPGEHHLLLSGRDAKGRMRVLQKPLSVSQQRISPWWFPATGFLTLSAVSISLVARRRRKPAIAQ